MIREKDILRIGTLTKTHGLRGEIAFNFENDIFDQVDCPYLVLDIDGIFVPFFMVEYRFKGSETALISFEGIDSEEKASKLQGLDVYFPREYLQDIDFNTNEENSWLFFIGFSVIDKQAGNLGIITDVDTQTINTLFLIVAPDKREIMIPAAEDFITEIDSENKIIYFSLPEGLLDIE